MLAEPTISTMSHDLLVKYTQELWVSKLELLAHLEKAQIELKTVAENTESRIGLYLRDKEHMEEELKMARARLD